MTPRVSGLDGVFVGSHAVGSGIMSRRQLRERGYRRLFHGVYALPDVALEHEVYCRAASLLLPEGAVIGGRSAACWHGGPSPSFTDPVTVLVPRNRKWHGPRGVRVHRTDLAAHEWGWLDDVPVTNPVRTAWDVATLEPAGVAVGTLDAMLRAGTITISDVQGMAATGTGRWRVTRVRCAAELVDVRAESPPESWLRVAFVQAGLLGFVPQYEVRAGAVFLARVDFAWPERKVAVEYEGAYHFEGLQIVRDDARLQGLLAAGWSVVRISASDLRDVSGVVDRVRRALDQRSLAS